MQPLRLRADYGKGQMPLDLTVTSTIKGFLTSHSIVGASSSQFAAGVATGLSTYAKSGMNVSTVDVGTLGSGKGTGFGVFIAPAILTQTLTASFASMTISGAYSPQLISAITMGITTALTSAVISTFNPGVGVGTGQLAIASNPIVAVQTFIGAFAFVGMVGLMAPSVATAIAIGLDNALPFARGTVAIAGPPSVLPGSGIGTGRLF